MRKFLAKYKLSRRRKLLILALLLLWGVWRYGYPLWVERQDNLKELKHSLKILPAAVSNDRVLVLSPHCDDETLACGGYISKAVQHGAEVRVVLVTNGDGFRYAAQRMFKEIRVKPKDFKALAAKRQAESIAALSSLGLPARNITFLGYPDGGTADMWLRFWDEQQLFTSPYTRANHNPYPNSMQPGSPYCGRSIIDNLKKIISSYKPTMLFCPHPNDNHSDHWALYCFTLAALYELNMLDDIKLNLYLVHRGDWPVPQGLHAQVPLCPPAGLTHLGTRWRTFPLDAKLAEEKKKAVMQYRSQIAVYRRFMTSFIRCSELFGLPAPGRLVTISENKIRIDGKIEDWNKMPVAMLDPAQDQGKVEVFRGGDLTKVYAARDDRRLYVRLDFWQRMSKSVESRLYLHLLTGGKVGPPRIYSFRPGRITLGAKYKAAGQYLEIAIPLPEQLKVEGIILGAESRWRNYSLDKTGWALLRTEDKSSQEDSKAAPADKPVQDQAPSGLNLK